MLFLKKKSFIIDWWIADKEDKFKFVDITDKRNLTVTSIVQGRTQLYIPEYTSSIHSVVNVTRKGVYTSSGRFYPFKTAHPLFLIFLYEIHTPNNALIASKWECVDQNNNIYIADIENASGEKQEKVLFDFVQSLEDEFFFVGTSDSLDDVVILNPFDMREISDNRAMRGAYPVEVYNSAVRLAWMRKKAIKNLRKILKKQNKSRKDMGS